MPLCMRIKSSRAGGRRTVRVADVVPALFDGTVLKDEAEIDAAMDAVSRFLVDPDTPHEEAVVALEAPRMSWSLCCLVSILSIFHFCIV